MADRDREIAEARAAVREHFRAVVRWRALYSRKRGLMLRLPRDAGDRLHDRLKDYEYDAIDAHQAAEHRLIELLFNDGKPIKQAPLRDCVGNVIGQTQ